MQQPAERQLRGNSKARPFSSASPRNSGYYHCLFLINIDFQSFLSQLFQGRLDGVITQKCVYLSKLGGGGEYSWLALMMTALNTWHTNAHFTAQSRPRPRGRAPVRRTVAGTVKGASATARRWLLPTSPTSISSLDRSVPHSATHTHMHAATALTHLLVSRLPQKYIVVISSFLFSKKKHHPELVSGNSIK